ncbi:Lipase 1 [Cytospora mali]|uniref:Lipase 1 n=1 Tax=Cytospora mali TaxID=578113 RepID=A0A194UVN1_CYTMA|nr:Lipase 1 [Valsa mali var. pyri (nom. inval.)]
MQFSLFTVLASACLLFRDGLALAIPSQQNDGLVKRTAIPPSEDPWYTAPDGYESASPGTVLRNRTATGLPAVAGSNGNATFAVTTIFVPSKDPTDALLAYQIPYDSAYINASPSYTLYGGVYEDIKVALGKGYFVTVPDYEGPLASFTAGHMSGYATLDAVRATLNAADLYGLSSDSLYAMWGYSGGALATEWASELQLDYASDLSFAGAAMGGLTPNVTSVLLSINEKISAGLAPPAIIGLTSQWPDSQEYVFSKLVNNTVGTYTAANFLAAENMTLSEAESAYAFQDITQYFVDGLADITGPEVSTAINNDGIMGLAGVPQMPVYAYKAVKDEISQISDTDALINKYCGDGANILYQRNLIGGHSAEETNGDPAATAFLDAVLTGTYAEHYNTTGCTIQNVIQGTDTSPLRSLVKIR